MRKLASIQKIWNIEPIDGADKIELAYVLGWRCVVNKGQFRKGDLAIYFEIDSFLPIREEFEFLRNSSYKVNPILGEGFKLKTMKFKGQVSQGLLLPLSTFNIVVNDLEKEIGRDVTEFLGVRKWEIEERATTGGTIIGQLPYDVPKTDETRCQACPELLEEFKGIEYYISTKCDGSSHSVSLDKDGFHVTGHNYEYKDDGKSSFYEYVKKNNIEEKIRRYCFETGIETLTVQGEFCGAGIQKNPLRLQSPDWFVFTVRINGERVGLDMMNIICAALDLKTVPIEEVDCDLPSKYPTIEALLERADGLYENGGKKEGIVIRPVKPQFSNTISASLSMKVVSNKYLIKNKE